MQEATSRAWRLHSRPRLLLLGVIGVVGLLLGAAVIVEHHLKSTVEHALAIRMARPVRIEGAFVARLLSVHPFVSAREVAVDNPAWMPGGVMARAGRVLALLEWHWALPPLQIRRLEIEQARVNLVRHADGHANWFLHEEGPGSGPPLIRSLSMPDAQVELHDQRRQLDFQGTVSAGDVARDDSVAPLRIEGHGQLNGRAASFTVDADPLAGVRRTQPYHFAAKARSGATHLSAQGHLEQPFDFRELQARFEAEGPDMQDLYYLLGVKPPATAAFRISGTFARHSLEFLYSDLQVSVGESDIGGSARVEGARPGDRAKVHAQLSATRLRLADLGSHAPAPAAGPVSEATRAGLLIPDTPFITTSLQRSDATVKFHAQELDAGPLVLREVSANVSAEQGVLVVSALQGKLAGGALTGEARLKTGEGRAHGELDMTLSDAQLDELTPGPGGAHGATGVLSARAQLQGTGDSLHALAASASGTLTAVIPHGTFPAAIAEAASLELSAVIGALAKSQKETDLRCAVASFEAQEGVLSARTLVLDTDKALIDGHGTVHMDTEALDFTLRGHPKRPSIALHSAVAVRGTLAHPQYQLSGGGAAAQAGAAVALGVALTPLAAVLAFVNPGLARNADCAGLLAQYQPAAAAPAAVGQK